VNPTLAVAKEFVRPGERVIYYLPESFRAAIEATGASFRSYPSNIGTLQQVGKTGPGHSPSNPLPSIMEAGVSDVSID
jgi:UDP:flavonoid glycosyltransferase YjiC (YdhE family)